MAYITIPHMQLSYQAHLTPESTRPPLILLHGAGGDHRHWGQPMRELPAITTYTLDLPMHGASRGAAVDPSAQSVAATVITFLNAMQIPRAILAGHSMGGAIAQQIALDAPEYVAALILIATAPRMRVSPLLLDNVLTNPEIAVEFVAANGYGPDAPAATIKLGKQIMRDLSPQTLLNDYHLCDSFDIRPRITSLTLPTLVIGSAADRMVPEKVLRLFETLPDVEFHWMDRVGHMIPFEAPDRTALIVSNWLERLKIDG